MPLLRIRDNPDVVSVLINPDRKDLEETRFLVRSLGLESRCSLESELIEGIDLPPSSFDLITSVSVIEHIPDDSRALEQTWRLLARGGKLFLTLPCARRESEQFISENPFGLLPTDPNGYVFWQRFYDKEALQSSAFMVV